MENILKLVSFQKTCFLNNTANWKVTIHLLFVTIFPWRFVEEWFVSFKIPTFSRYKASSTLRLSVHRLKPVGNASCIGYLRTVAATSDVLTWCEMLSSWDFKRKDPTRLSTQFLLTDDVYRTWWKFKEAWFVQHVELYIHIYHQALLAKKTTPIPQKYLNGCKLRTEKWITIHYLLMPPWKRYTQTFHWHMTNVYFVCFTLILDKKMPSVSAFEGDGRIRIWTSEARLSIDPCRGDVSGKLCGRRASSVFVVFCMGPGIFLLGRYVLFIEAIFGSEKSSLKDVTIPNPARHPRTSMRNFPATWLQGLC